MRLKELDKTLANMPNLPDKDRESIDRMTSAMMNKVFHKPIVNLKKKAETEEGHEYLKAIRYLFGIDD